MPEWQRTAWLTVMHGNIQHTLHERGSLIRRGHLSPGSLVAAIGNLLYKYINDKVLLHFPSLLPLACFVKVCMALSGCPC